MPRNIRITALVFSLLLGLCVQASAVNCFWVGGTATWDGSNFTSWSTTTGGAGAGCPGATNVPTSSDVAIFDGNSGGGTVTVNATISVSALTTGAFTGTLDFSANNNNVNLGVTTPTASSWTDNGSGTHTINMGNGTWTLDSTAGAFIFNFTGSNFTLNANSSTISVLAKANVTRFIGGGAKTFNNVTVNGAASSVVSFGAASTVIAALTLTNQTTALFSANYTITTLSVTSSASAPVGIRSSTAATSRTLTLTNNFTPSFVALQDITFSGGTNTASNSFDFGNNSGITINGPSGSGGGKMIGG